MVALRSYTLLDERPRVRLQILRRREGDENDTEHLPATEYALPVRLRVSQLIILAKEMNTYGSGLFVNCFIVWQYISSLSSPCIQPMDSIHRSASSKASDPLIAPPVLDGSSSRPVNEVVLDERFGLDPVEFKCRDGRSISRSPMTLWITRNALTASL